MVKYGFIAGVGIIAVFMIIIGNTFGFHAGTIKGLTFTGIGILLILASVEIFSLHWILGLVVLLTSLVYLHIGITAFSIVKALLFI